VLLSSHILSEVESAVRSRQHPPQGRVVQRGTLDELRRVTRTNVVATLERIPADIDAWPGIHDPLVHDTRLRCDVETPALTEFMGRLTACGSSRS